MKINPLYALCSTILFILLWALSTSGTNLKTNIPQKNEIVKSNLENNIENVEQQLDLSDSTIDFISEKISSAEKIHQENLQLKAKLQKVNDTICFLRRELSKRIIIDKMREIQDSGDNRSNDTILK